MTDTDSNETSVEQVLADREAAEIYNAYLSLNPEHQKDFRQMVDDFLVVQENERLAQSPEA